ncbi:E3 ubiquitin-protein ligase DTX3L-like isoform X2 [Lithobates pipiens]
MTDSTFENGDPKKPHLKESRDSTGHRESEKDKGNGAPKGEEQDTNSSTRRSSIENDKSLENSAASSNESRKLTRTFSKEGKSRLAAPPEDYGASGSSAEKGYKQENYQYSDIQTGENSSLTGSGSMDGGPKRHRDGFTSRGGDDYRRDGAIDRNEQDPNTSVPTPLRVNGEKSLDQFLHGNEHGRNSLGCHMSPEEPVRNRPSSPPESFQPFISVTARLDKKWFGEVLQEEVKVKIPRLTIKAEFGVVEVMGTFGEIASLYQHLEKRSQEQDLGAEKPPDTSSDWSPTDSQADQVSCPSALYEYIMEIHRTEMDQIERSFGVKISHRSAPDGSTSVRFVPQGPESSPEKAKETFTDKVQKVTADWSQVDMDPSVVPLTFSDIKERVADRWRNTLVIRGENKGIILRGPRDELSQVKKFLEKADHKSTDHKSTDHKSARPRRSVKISTGNMRTEMEVDARHMDILKKLKLKEISDIEKKYNVHIEENRKNGSSLVTFKSVNAPPDLSAHASHSFITLLQKTFFNIQKKIISVKPELQDGDFAIVQEKLMMGGIAVVMEYSKGTVILIGHPVHVAFAEEKLNGNQNPGRSQTAAPSGEPMHSSRSSAAAQKAEEPDTCPICQCEIEDKVILEKCKHAYCRGCLKELTARKPVCAICGDSYGKVTGDQPDGTMRDTRRDFSLPGYPGCGTIEINYNIPGGTQKENHPSPGRHFSGASRTAFLPDNQEGREILRLLRRAFDQKLIFTVGESRTSGLTDTVTWNDVHHKTNISGGPTNFGYPDPDYLKRVRDELKAKGIE